MNEERYQRGKQVRESILGHAHAARTAKNRTAFNADFQDFLMEYAWGGIWARPGLDHKTRSMITIAALTALGREAELKAHIRGGLNVGLSREQIVEIILQLAFYAGQPAAHAGFRAAKEVFDQIDAAGR